MGSISYFELNHAVLKFSRSRVAENGLKDLGNSFEKASENLGNSTESLGKSFEKASENLKPNTLGEKRGHETLRSPTAIVMMAMGILGVGVGAALIGGGTGFCKSYRSFYSLFCDGLLQDYIVRGLRLYKSRK